MTALSPSIAARVLGLIVIVAGIATAPLGSPITAAFALTAVGLLLLLTRPRPLPLLRRGLPALIGVGALSLPIALTDPQRAALLAARATLALTAALAIASTIPSGRLGPALSALGLPASIAAVLTTLLRQLTLLGSEARRLWLARRLRGARGVGASTEMMAALLVKSAARAERVELAMRLRGYDERHAPAGVVLRVADTPALACAALVATALHVVALS